MELELREVSAELVGAVEVEEVEEVGKLRMTFLCIRSRRGL